MMQTETLVDQFDPQTSEMAENAAEAAAYLKTLAHKGRLMILCHLNSGEKSVSELEALLDIRQAVVSGGCAMGGFRPWQASA